MKLLLLVAAVVLAGCANTAPPMAKGPWHPLNDGKWSFNSNDLVQPPLGMR